MGVKVSKLSRIIRVCGDKCLRGPPSTPRAYIPISVGENDETKRFMVHPAALGDADFMELLCLSAEEYGFCNDGILRIRYEAEAFVDWYIKGAKQKMFKVRTT
ncbi:unnamed protein product [Ilex paraguariensis]|uniref:Uncharacterized protein n=1 Tax=Ilex paraguariensis TaxID=185542 RepID=A0ABC8UFN8_9AQUA